MERSCMMTVNTSKTTRTNQTSAVAVNRLPSAWLLTWQHEACLLNDAEMGDMPSASPKASVHKWLYSNWKLLNILTTTHTNSLTKEYWFLCQFCRKNWFLSGLRKFKNQMLVKLILFSLGWQFWKTTQTALNRTIYLFDQILENYESNAFREYIWTYICMAIMIFCDIVNTYNSRVWKPDMTK